MINTNEISIKVVEQGSKWYREGYRWVVVFGAGDSFRFFKDDRAAHTFLAQCLHDGDRTDLRLCKGGCGDLEDPRWGGYCDGCAP